MDRVRGAIFSSLGERVPEARVLDLFAGSGALGIEALSRGAASATFVEHLGATTGLIRKNLQSTRLDRLPTTVQQMDAFRFLDLYVEEEGFDLIFADPPYLKDTRPSAGDVTNLADNLLSHPNMPKALGFEGLLILECERRQPLPSLTPSTSPIPWEILSDRNYGESRILILRRAP